jgi:hypothetical protein
LFFVFDLISHQFYWFCSFFFFCYFLVFGIVVAPAHSHNSKHGGPAPFNSMVRMRTSVGLQPARDMGPRLAADANPALATARRDTDVVGRHKRWLREQQRAVAEARDAEVREMIEMEERANRFRDEQRRKRETLRAQREAEGFAMSGGGGGGGGGGVPIASRSVGASAGYDAEGGSYMGHSQSYGASAAAGLRQDEQMEQFEQFRREKAAKRRKQEMRKQRAAARRVVNSTVPNPAGAGAASGAVPKWALTQHAAEEVEEEELGDLLDFAEGLDYASYIEDYNVRQALSLVKTRVAQLEKAQERYEEYLVELSEGEEDAEGDDIVETEDPDTGAPKRMRRVRRRVIGKRRDPSGMSEEERRAREAGWVDPGLSRAPPHVREAQALLSSKRELGAVHSRASLRNVAYNVSSAAPAPPPMPGLRRVHGLEIEQEERRVTRREVDPSQLPYLYRNPAI